MNYDVHVMQIISNGPEGFPKDEVVDVGICAVDLDTMEVDSVYSMMIRHDTSSWDDDKKGYIINANIPLNDVDNGMSVNDVCNDVKRILNGRDIASFDIRNVFYRYMVNEPWDLTKEASIMPSICSRLPSSQRCTVPAEENVKIREAYEKMFKDDPMDIGTGTRALDHALMSSAILMELRKRGKY